MYFSCYVHLKADQNTFLDIFYVSIFSSFSSEKKNLGTSSQSVPVFGCPPILRSLWTHTYLHISHLRIYAHYNNNCLEYYLTLKQNWIFNKYKNSQPKNLQRYLIMVSWHKGSNGRVWAPNPGGRSPHHEACNRSSDVQVKKN